MKNASSRSRLFQLSSTLFTVISLGCSAEAPSDPQTPTVDSEEDLRLLRRCAGPRNLTCPESRYCNGTAGSRCPGPDQFGVCAVRPDTCTDQFDPVCGCDGVTYSNACFAARAGVAVDHRGECAPRSPFCGGIAGFPCPGSGTCIDDPSDDCDPNQGGADCGGICICKASETCAPGSRFNSDPAVCAGSPGAGTPCGKSTCSSDQFCCNASCGICAPKGGACIQIACD